MTTIDSVAQRVLELLFRVTGIDIFFYSHDRQMISRPHHLDVVQDFLLLSGGRVEEYIHTLLAQKEANQTSYHVYFLESNLLCVLSPLMHDGDCAGILITQPLSTGPLASEMAGTPLPAGYEPEISSEIKDALSRVPLVPYNSTPALGETLSILGRYIAAEPPARPTMAGIGLDHITAHLAVSGHATRLADKAGFLRHSPDTYQSLKAAVSAGDALLLNKAFDSLDMSGMNWDTHTSKDTLRSIKNGYIERASHGATFAIDAGADYIEIKNALRHFVSHLEVANNPADLHRLSRMVFFTFTRAVALARITTYSRHVGAALDYLEDHYCRKVSLKQVANKLKLSEYYLSTLIKKETGSNFMDHLNRIRIDQSKKLMVNPGHSLQEIATQVGFSYGSHFSRVFRQYTGMSPTEYLRNLKHNAEASAETEAFPRLLLGQLAYGTGFLPGIFAQDKISGKVWSADGKEEWILTRSGRGLDVVHNLPPDAWEGNSCARCATKTTHEHQSPATRINNENGNPQVITTFPISFQGEKYTLELAMNLLEECQECQITPHSILKTRPV